VTAAKTCPRLAVVVLIGPRLLKVFCGQQANDSTNTLCHLINASAGLC